MSMRPTADGDALVAKAGEACRLLSCGRVKLYDLIAAGEVVSYLDGGIRKITVESIRGYIRRQIESPRAATPARIRKLRQLRNQPPSETPAA